MNKTLINLFVIWLVCSTAVRADVQLIEAIKTGDTASISKLIRDDANLNEQAPDGTTAMHWAIHLDEPEIATLLIEAGANLNIADQGGATPLWVAVYSGNTEMVKRLLEAGSNPNVPLSSGETPLMTASENGNLEIVQSLLSAGADVNAKENEAGQTALMWSVAESHPDISNELINHGADVRNSSKAGFTPLHFAALNGSLDSARILVSMDAEVNAISKDEMSPLLLASASGHDELTRYLLEQGANPNERNFRGYTALHFAVMQRKMLASVRSLLEKGADPNARIMNAESDHELKPVPDLPFLQSPTRIIETGVRGATLPTGATPVYIAAQNRNPDALRLLVENGGDINMPTTESVYYLGGSGRRINYIAGTTPLMAAAGMDRVTENWIAYSEDLEKQAFETVKVAIELGGDVNATNEYGMTALHAACFINADGIVEYLVKSGSDIDAMDIFGQTPVSISRHVIVAGLGDYFDVRPRRSSPSTFALLMKLGATPLEESGVVAR